MNNEEFYEVNELTAVNATQNVSPKLDDSYMNADGEDDEFFNASANSQRRKDQRYRRREQRQKRRDERSKSSAEARLMKAEAKKGLSEAQKEAAKSMGADDSGALARSIAESGSGDKKMSKGMKIGLIIGGVALLGIIGFVVYKKMKK